MKKDPMMHMTSLREELSDQVTTPTILICNINNETIKICNSCKQFSTVQCIQIREHVLQFHVRHFQSTPKIIGLLCSYNQTSAYYRPTCLHIPVCKYSLYKPLLPSYDGSLVAGCPVF